MAEIDDVRRYVEDAMGGGDAALVVVSAFVVGPNVKRISVFTGLPRETVAEYARLLRQNGIWRGGKILVEGEDGPDGIETALMVGVALGHFETVAA